MRVRLGVVDRRAREALDADDGQNDDRRGFVGLGTAEAHDAPVIREFYDVAHQSLPPTTGTDRPIPIR